jgi:hypothetical protein
MMDLKAWFDRYAFTLRRVTVASFDISNIAVR